MLVQASAQQWQRPRQQVRVVSPRMNNSVVPESLLALAPLHLRNRRQQRYLGDDSCIALEGLAPPDQTLLGHFYRVLSALLYAIADTATDDAQKWRDVILWTQHNHLDELIDQVNAFGDASHAQEGASEALAKVVHDVRGGALSALLGRLQLLFRLPQDEKNLKTLFILSRDHLKIMRNAVTGLDEPRREADRAPKSHAMGLMLDKWHESMVGPKWCERPVLMFVDCRYDGALTECCLESAAIDRIFYNLAANACRHSASERLDMAIFPIPEPPGECLRFVLSNQVSDWDVVHLHTFVPGGTSAASHEGLSSLFAPKVSTTGSGYGLTVVADFVASAFGLRDREEALWGGYVGAVLDGHTFRVWFHWPMARSDIPKKLDDYHRPQESLSEP